MEIRLKGKVESIDYSYGVIFSDSFNEKFIFLKSNIINEDKLKIKKNDLVSFELKPNNKGVLSSAIKIRLIKENNNNKKNFEINNYLKIENFQTILNKFQSFCNEDFCVLKTKNEELNALIKSIVQDNIITKVEKKFLNEKTKELNLSKNLIDEALKYINSNNPYLDNIFGLVFKDGYVKINEIDFLYEKTKEYKYTKSFVNRRFWQFAITFHFNKILKNDSFIKIIKLWYLTNSSRLDIAINKDWLFLKLNIFNDNNFEKNIDSALNSFEEHLTSFLLTQHNFSKKNLIEIYDSIILKDNNYGYKNYEKNTSNLLITDNLYKKTDLYNIFKVPKKQQQGKWHKGYCEHKDNWFIFTNLGQKKGHGYDDKEYNYNNELENGKLKWEATNESKLTWKSIQSLKISSPYIFIKRSDTKKNHWEFKGKGNCIKVKDVTPVSFIWEINKQNSKNNESVKITQDFNLKNTPYWNDKFIPSKYKKEIHNNILKCFSGEPTLFFEIKMNFTKYAFDNGNENYNKIDKEFDKICKSLEK